MANSLCKDVLASLINWKALTAALQCGGLERIGEGRIYIGLENWLNAQRSNLLLLSQYQKTDYVLIDPASVGTPRLKVDTLFEVKFSYAVQLSHAIPSALMKAHDQVQRYIKSVNPQHAYIIYFIAGPVWPNVVGTPRKRDAGWHYWRTQAKAPKLQDEKERVDSACRAISANGKHSCTLIGAHEAPHGNHWLYCVLIEVL